MFFKDDIDARHCDWPVYQSNCVWAIDLDLTTGLEHYRILCMAVSYPSQCKSKPIRSQSTFMPKINNQEKR